MEKEIKEMTIKELLDGFVYLRGEDRALYGMNGKLIITPEYQRNYIYGDGIKDVAVVQSILRNWPIGSIYLYKIADNSYELMDGQQRLTSIGRFIQHLFSVCIDNEPMYYDNLSKEVRDTFMSYKIPVCICSGATEEILSWFRVLNTAGVPLNEQEVLNAIYSSPFVAGLRREFSNSTSPRLQNIYQRFIPGNPKRQDILATVLSWYVYFFSDEYASVKDLLARAQSDSDNTITPDVVATHINSLTNWAMTTFKKYDPLMKGVDWGRLFKLYCLTRYDSDEMYADLQRLKEDPAVTKQSGIFEYLLSGKTDPRLLNIRLFDEPTRRSAYNTQTAAAREANISNCPLCAQSNDEHRRTKIYEYKDMEADHIEAWRNGGTTTADNCQMLCKTCNRTKSYH